MVECSYLDKKAHHALLSYHNATVALAPTSRLKHGIVIRHFSIFSGYFNLEPKNRHVVLTKL